MAMFQEYKGGIQPLSGISEAGARIGEMYNKSLGGLGKDLAEGLAVYYKNEQEAARKKTSLLTQEAMASVKPYDTERETLKFQGAQFGIQSEDPNEDTSTIQNFVNVNKKKYETYKNNVIARAAEVGMPSPSFDREDVIITRAISGLSNQLDSSDFVGSEADKQTLKTGLATFQQGIIEQAEATEFDALAQMWSQPEDVGVDEFLAADDAYYGAEESTAKIVNAAVKSSPAMTGYDMGPDQTLEQAKAAQAKAVIDTTSNLDLSPENRQKLEAVKPLILQSTQTLFVSEAPSFVASSKIDPKTGGTANVKSLNPVMISGKYDTPEKFAQLSDPAKAAEFYDDHRNALVEHWASKGFSTAEISNKLNEWDAERTGWKPKSDGPKKGESTKGYEDRRAQDAQEHLNRIVAENQRAATSPLATAGKAVGYTAAGGLGLKGMFMAGKWGYGKAVDGNRATAINKVVTAYKEKAERTNIRAAGLGSTKPFTSAQLLEKDIAKEVKAYAAANKIDLSKATVAQIKEIELAARKKLFDRIGEVKAPKGAWGLAWNATKIGLGLAVGTYAGSEALDYGMPLVNIESAITSDVDYFFNRGGLATETSRAQAQVNASRTAGQVAVGIAAQNYAEKAGVEFKPSADFETAFAPPQASIVNAGIGMAPVQKDAGLYTKQVFDYVKNAFPDADLDVITHVMKGMRPNHEFISDPQTGARFVLIRDSETGATKSVEQIKSFGTADGTGNILGKPIMGDDGRLRGYMPLNLGDGAVSVLGTFAPNIPQKEASRVTDNLENLSGALDVLQRMETVFNQYGSEIVGENATYYNAAAMQMAALFRKRLGDAGTLTNQDVERLMAQIPNPSGISGTFTFNSSHRAKFAFIKAYIENQIRQTGDRYNLGIRVRQNFSGSAKSAMQGIPSSQTELTDRKIQLQTQRK